MGKYDNITVGLSYLNQVTMETGRMDPLSYMYLIDQYKKELGDLGFDFAIKNGVDINGNIVGVKRFNDNPLMNIIQGSEGYSFNPLKVLSSYRAQMLRKFMMHGEKVMKTPERDGNSWEDSWKSDQTGGWCKGI